MLTPLAFKLNGVVTDGSLPPGTVMLDRLDFGDSLAPSSDRLDGFVLGGPLAPGAVRINGLVDGFYQPSTITWLYRTNAGFGKSFFTVSCARLCNLSHVCSAM